MDGPSISGKLLVAAPGLTDPNFARTVVLMLEHHDEGALGLILNRPALASVADVLPVWAGMAAEPALVFEGGPVSAESAIALARARDAVSGEGFRAVHGTIGSLDLSMSPIDVSVSIEELRIFAGYAGWAGGQLEGELAMGGWIVVDSQPADAFTPNPQHLWRDVLLRQGGHLAVVARYPLDIDTN